MKKKVALILSIIITGSLSWYLFIKPYDYLVTLKVNTFPGTINQTIKLWSKTIDSSAKVIQEDLQNLVRV